MLWVTEASSSIKVRSTVVSIVIVYSPLAAGPVRTAQADVRAVSLVSEYRANEVAPQRRSVTPRPSITLFVGAVKVAVAVLPSVTETEDGVKLRALIVAVAQGSVTVIVKTTLSASVLGVKYSVAVEPALGPLF